MNTQWLSLTACALGLFWGCSTDDTTTGSDSAQGSTSASSSGSMTGSSTASTTGSSAATSSTTSTGGSGQGGMTSTGGSGQGGMATGGSGGSGGSGQGGMATSGSGGSGQGGTSTGGSGQGGMSTGGSGQGGMSTGGSGQGGTTSSSTGTGGTTAINCNAVPPPGATLAPAPPPYSGGTCPTLVEGHNLITSQGNMRDFRLVIPTNLAPNERLPVVFLWHWLGGSADDFYTRGEIQLAADTQRFLGVIPESKDDVLFKWPFETTQSTARMNEEFTFFDDMLTCVSAQFNVNKECVASAGVSAGALFTDQLAGGRGNYLSSIISLSGGTGGFIKPFGNPTHKMPAVVLWGGPTDTCFGVMNFDTASKNLEQALTTQGHFFLECIHNCGHAEPPLDKPPGLSTYAAMWQFVLDHPYWLTTGQSPYLQGIPSMYPTWCAIGAGSCTPRTGTCPNPPGC